MKYKISEAILNANIPRYVDEAEHIEQSKDILDCSAGENPYGPPPEAVSALKQIELGNVVSYPHGNELRRALTEYLPGDIAVNNISLCFGAMEGIFRINSAFAREAGDFVAFAPNFIDANINAMLLGFNYVPVLMDPSTNYAMDLEKLAKAITPECSLVYIDNPNNPTGQAVTPEELLPILDKARDCGACVVVDEAYGDFVPLEYSATPYLSEYDNLIVLRTMSKGFGMAGVRIGYIVASKELCAIFELLGDPYIGSMPARILSLAAIRGADFLEQCNADFAKIKSALRDALPPGLHMAKTYDSVSVCMLYHDDPDLDLQKAFAAQGVFVYSGTGFDSLGINSVRLRLPHINDMDRLIGAVKAIG